MARNDLSDEEWRLVGPLLAKPRKRMRRGDDRRVANGIVQALRADAP